MLKKYGIIYKATNLINSKVYIGQTTMPLYKRKSSHIKNKKKTGFAGAIEKYGKEKFIFEEIYTAFDKSELDKAEEFFIKLYDSTNNKRGYNLVALATHSTKGYKHSKESVARMMAGRKNRIYKPHSEETKRKLSEIKKGKPTGRKITFSEETKKKISQTLKNKYSNDSAFKNRVCEHLKNPSDKTKEKMSKSKLGRKMSEETKLKIGAKLKGTCNRWKNKKTLENEGVTNGN
jgi:group I intron endonuclease